MAPEQQTVFIPKGSSARVITEGSGAVVEIHNPNIDSASLIFKPKPSPEVMTQEIHAILMTKLSVIVPSYAGAVEDTLGYKELAGGEQKTGAGEEVSGEMALTAIQKGIDDWAEMAEKAGIPKQVILKKVNVLLQHADPVIREEVKTAITNRINEVFKEKEKV